MVPGYARECEYHLPIMHGVPTLASNSSSCRPGAISAREDTFRLVAMKSRCTNL